MKNQQTIILRFWTSCHVIRTLALKDCSLVDCKFQRYKSLAKLRERGGEREREFKNSIYKLASVWLYERRGYISNCVLIVRWKVVRDKCVLAIERRRWPSKNPPRFMIRRVRKWRWKFCSLKASLLRRKKLLCYIPHLLFSALMWRSVCWQ